MKKIIIKYKSDDIERLRYIDGKSDWIDLRSCEDVTLKAGEAAFIPFGIAMKLPEGYEAHIVPRSSTFKNFGIIQTNHRGVIDESYSPEDVEETNEKTDAAPEENSENNITDDDEIIATQETTVVTDEETDPGSAPEDEDGSTEG